MRKLDLLIIKSFIGPFILTTALSTFILLIQHMLKYFDDFVGKDLGFFVFAKLLFYFSLNMLQIALPLGVLVSSLMTFGNLGEHFELTAIKSAGISLTRALRPIFIFVLFISIGAFFFNDNVLPAANLKAYSLLYDIKHKKPTLDIQEGVFYRGIPNYIIKAREKFADDETLKDVIIYDHSNSDGNRRVITADSSRMYLFMNDRYLKLELYEGYYYSENRIRGKKIDQFNRTEYSRMDMVFSLASFEFDPTDEDLFRGNRQMMKIAELNVAIDSMRTELQKKRKKSFSTSLRFFSYKDNFKVEPNRFKAPERQVSLETGEQRRLKDVPDSVRQRLRKSGEANKTVSKPDSGTDVSVVDDKKEVRASKPVKTEGHEALDSITLNTLDFKIFKNPEKLNSIYSTALQQARNVKNSVTNTANGVSVTSEQMNRYKLEKYKKYSQAFACLVMFLIGAPLGSIIKKGGLGVPVIISVFFFIIYYVLSITGEEYAKADAMDGQYAVWIANVILFPIGLFFLRQARIDARLFDKDIYIIWWDRMREKYGRRKKLVNS